MATSVFLMMVLIGAGKYEPPPHKTMVLIGCDWSDNFKQYKNLTGDTPAGGVFWYEFNGDTNFFWHNARENVGPGSVLAIHFWFVDHRTVNDILSGKKDENIRKIGEAFKEWGYPIFADIGPEFDYKENAKKYTPKEYVSVFRRVHRIWDDIGVTNVAYVWHSSVEDNNLNERTWDYYPGEEYVDWFGMSSYSLQQFRAPEPVMFASAARRRKKPVIIMESGCPNGKTSSFNDWHGPFLRYASKLGVKAFCYNNFRNHPLIDMPFKHSAFDQLPPSIAKSWGRAMKSPTYLHPNQLYKLNKGSKIASQATNNSSSREKDDRRQGRSSEVGGRQTRSRR